MEEQVESLLISENLKRFSADILEWKRKYSNIYYLKVGKQEYVFRLLTKGEYLALYFVQFHISSEAEDILLDKCILYPVISREQRESLLAGEVMTLVDKILSLSGFSNIDNIKVDLDREREKIQLLDNQIVLIICKAFPHITPSDIDNFDYPTTLHYISLAEELLGTKLEISKVDTKPNTINFEKDNKEQGFIMSAFPPNPDVKQ